MATFAEVVASGSFTAAADRLGLSKAFVSKQISQLESRFSVQLLRRTTRRLVLTEEGERFYDYCRRMTETAREGLAALESRSHEVSGPLRITAPITFGQVYLPRLAAGFCTLYPQVSVDLRLENQFIDLTGVDIAFRITAGTPSDRLAVTPLGVLEEAVCATPAYWKTHGEPDSVNALAEHECLLYLHADRLSRWVFRRAREVKVVEVKGKLASNHHAALLGPLLEGYGVARLPEYLVRPYLADGRLRSVLADWKGDSLPIYALHHSGPGQSPRVREFLKYVLQEL